VNDLMILQKAFKICKDTDLRGKSAQIIKNVPTVNDCAQRCSNIAACTQAVFDSAVQVCHIKADLKTDTLIWSTDKRYDVIRRDIAAAPSRDGVWSDMIRLPVIPVAAYVVPEYPSSQRLMFFSSWAADAFGGASGRTQFGDYNFNT
jgi:galactose oxidase